jgi:transposase
LSQIQTDAVAPNIILNIYSHNLNPIERLWKIMNEYVRHNKYFATAKDVRNKICEFLAKYSLNEFIF